MYGIYTLEKYVQEGGKKNAKEALKEMYKGAAMAAENFYTLGKLMKMSPGEALKQLEDDANDDVEYWFTIGEDEPQFGLRQPDVKWEEVLRFDTKIEAKKAYEKQKEIMSGDGEWVTGIRRQSKSEEAAHDKVRNLRIKVMDMEHDLDFYTKQIERAKEKIAKAQAELPDKKKELENATKEYEEKFGRKWMW